MSLFHPGQRFTLRLAGMACACLPALAMSPSAAASKTNTLEQALAQSTPSLSLRLRHESNAQDNALRDANANTVRHRMGLTTGRWQGLAFKLESEGVIALGDEDYNSGPGGNGQTTYSVSADPTGNELNQAYLSYRPAETSELRIGRQRIIYDNARFIGNVGWRQNEQTFDAASLKTNLAGTRVQYAYLSNVNRIFFDNVDLDGHLLNLHRSYGAALSASLYGYWLDYQAGEDTQTLGLRLTGGHQLDAVKLGYALELARQSEHADSAPLSADYSLIELSLAASGVKLTLGQEVLGAENGRGFSTPLATAHKFNGFADIFLATPGTGLKDQYLGLAYTSGAWKLVGAYHRFDADQGDTRYGSEFDAVLKYQHSKKASLLLKYASYSADALAVDTDKLTLDLNFSL